MERDEYIKIEEVGEKMWWFRALHCNMLNALKHYIPDQKGNLLDDGCGAGGFLKRFQASFASMSAFGIDKEFNIAKIARRRSGAEVVVGTANILPFSDNVFSACVSANVMCHKGADPREYASEAFRCLKPGGILIVNVPAYDWLFSVHDRRVDDVRRYTRTSLARTLEEVGFQIEYATYWNTFLFALMVLRRKVFTSNDGESDLKMMPPLVEAVFNVVMKCECAILSLGMRKGLVFLPFGGSVLVVVKRPK